MELCVRHVVWASEYSPCFYLLCFYLLCFYLLCFYLLFFYLLASIRCIVLTNTKFPGKGLSRSTRHEDWEGARRDTCLGISSLLSSSSSSSSLPSPLTFKSSPFSFKHQSSLSFLSPRISTSSILTGRTCWTPSDFTQRHGRPTTSSIQFIRL